MPAAIVKYCAQDVLMLPVLYDVYDAKLRLPGNAFWQSLLREATLDRVKLALSATYDPLSKDKSRGPWTSVEIEERIDAWNDKALERRFYGEDY